MDNLDSLIQLLSNLRTNMNDLGSVEYNGIFSRDNNMNRLVPKLTEICSIIDEINTIGGLTSNILSTIYEKTNQTINDINSIGTVSNKYKFLYTLNEGLRHDMSAFCSYREAVRNFVHDSSDIVVRTTARDVFGGKLPHRSVIKSTRAHTLDGHTLGNRTLDGCAINERTIDGCTLDEHAIGSSPIAEQTRGPTGRSSQNETSDRLSFEISKKNITSIEGISVDPATLAIPILPQIDYCPTAFYWYSGTASRKAGIYVRLLDNVICRVPFPNLFCSSSSHFKKKTIKCKYHSVDICQNNRKKYAVVNKVKMRECNYTHKGEHFNRIGSAFRCSVESFGGHDTLANDLRKVKYDDIKLILMNSLHDILLATLWFQTNADATKHILIDDLDVC